MAAGEVAISKNCQLCVWKTSAACYPLRITKEGVECRGRIYGASNKAVPSFSTRKRMPKVR